MTKLKLMHLPKNITLIFRIAKQTIYFFRKKKEILNQLYNKRFRKIEELNDKTNFNNLV